MLNVLEKKHDKLDVIVTNGWTRISYNILRSLGRRGLRVGLGVDSRSGMSVYSRYNSKTLYQPSFQKDGKGFIASVKQAILTYRPSVYIPADDDIFIVAKHIDEFKDLPGNIPIASTETLNLLDNKNEASELAKSLDIPVPETIKPGDEKEIEAFSHEYGTPVVLKISHSSAALGVFYLHKDNLLSSLQEIMKNNGINFGDFIVQRFVRGTGYGVSMLFDHGEMKAKFTHKRLREKLFTGGPSTLRESVKNPLLEEWAERLLKPVGFHGVVMVEFKYNEQSKNGWFIEVNPRFWGSLALAVHSGVDFPFMLYKMAVDGNIAPVLDYKTGIRVRWLFGDLLALKNLFMSTKILPGLKDIFARADGYDDFYPDDPIPFAAEFFLQLKRVIKRNLLKREI